MRPAALRFSEICAASDPVGASLALFMGWLSASDGSIADEEVAGIRATFVQSSVGRFVTEIIELATTGEVEAFELAARIIRKNVLPAQRKLYLEVLTQIALADGVETASFAQPRATFCDSSPTFWSCRRARSTKSS